MCTEGGKGVGRYAMEFRFQLVYLVKTVGIEDDVFREKSLMKREKRLS